MSDSDTPPRSGYAGVRSDLQRAFSSLRIYNYRLYYAGQFVSQTGTWMQRLGQAWLVLNLTHSPFALGVVTTLQALPITLFSLFGGVIADRMPKRTLLIYTGWISLVQAVILAALTSFGIIQIWELYVLALVLGLANAFDNPARQSFPVELVGRGDVANAIALNSTLNNGSRIIGPSLAGIAIATIGVAGCFWLNALSFLAVIAGLFAMRPREFYSVPMPQRGPARELLAQGISYSLRTPAVFSLLFALLFVGTFGYNFNTFIPLVSRFLLHTNSFQYGLLFSALGAGSLIAAFGIALSRGGGERSIYLGGAIFIALLGVLGLSRIYQLSVVTLFVTGMASIVFSTATQTRLQLIAANEFRGRIMGIYTLLQQGSTPIGAMFLGTIAQRWNVSAAIEAAVAIGGVGLFFAWVYARKNSGAIADEAAIRFSDVGSA